MSKFREAKISFKRDAEGKGIATFDCMYPTHDASTGVASPEFIEEIVQDFLPKLEVPEEGAAK